MAYVVPFRGLRYNLDIDPGIEDLVSPPYDVVSPAERERYHRKHPHNAIRLDFGLPRPGDDDDHNPYTRAAALLASWQEEGLLIPEAAPCLYLLREEFTAPGGARQVRRGFVAALKLADFSEGAVLPHEETSSGPKKDRLRLMEATGANLSPIFCLYSDPRHRVEEALETAAASAKTVADFTDEAGTRQTMWAVDDPQVASLVTGELKDKPVLIADGHHRYETALAYRNRRRQASVADPEPYDFTMAYLSCMEDSPQSILPIHRLIRGLKPETLAGITDLLGPEFEVKQLAAPAAGPPPDMLDHLAGAGRERNAFILYLPRRGSFSLLTARRPRPLLSRRVSGHSAAWRSLDISVLDELILRQLLGISPGGMNAGARVDFVERSGGALEAAAGCDAAFLVNPATMAEIQAVARAGEKMPRKSTYFHPKPLTGLVFRSFKL